MMADVCVFKEWYLSLVLIFLSSLFDIIPRPLQGMSIQSLLSLLKSGQEMDFKMKRYTL